MTTMTRSAATAVSTPLLLVLLIMAISMIMVGVVCVHWM
jgi:hypothetical protein